MEPTELEVIEAIDMLRVIENGYKVRMVPTKHIVKSVDNDNDRKKVEDLMGKDSLYKIYQND